MSSLGIRMNDEKFEEVDDEKEVDWDDNPLDVEDDEDEDEDDAEDDKE